MRWNDALLSGESPSVTLNVIFEELIREIGASYGIICRYSQRRHDKESDAPFHPVLCVLSIANVVWSDELSRNIDITHDLVIKVGKHDILSEPLRTGEPFISNSVTAERDTILPGLPSLSSYLGIPIMAGCGECVGVLGLANSVNGVWRSDDWKLLTPMASMIGTMILMSESIAVLPESHPNRSKYVRIGCHASDASHTLSFSSPIAPFFDLTNPSMSSPSPTLLHSLSSSLSSHSVTETNSHSPSNFPLRLTPPSSTESKSGASDDNINRRKSDTEGQEVSRLPKSDSNIEIENIEGSKSVTADADKPKNVKQQSSMDILSPFVTSATSKPQSSSHSETKVTLDPFLRRRSTIGERAPRKYFTRKNKYAQRMDYMGRALVHVFESLSDGIVVFNDSMRIITCNQSLVTLTGFKDAKELLTTYPRFDSILRPIFRYEDKHEKGSEVIDREKKVRNSDWRSDLQNLLFLAKSSRRIRLEAMIRRKATHLQIPSDSQTHRDGQRSSDPNPRINDEKLVNRHRSSSAEDAKPSNAEESFCSVDVNISYFTYKNENFYSAVFRDVTQDKLYREKDTLLAFLSHEIRNPVQAITLGCQLLLEKSHSRDRSAEIQ